MNRRAFAKTTVLGVIATAVGATEVKKDPECWRLPAKLDDAQFEALVRKVSGDHETLAFSLRAHRSFNKKYDLFRHDGALLDGAWTGLNFPRRVLLDNIADWLYPLNHWLVPEQIVQWRRVPIMFSWVKAGGRNKTVTDEWLISQEWQYGLFLAVSRILEEQPREFRLRLANINAQKLGYQDVYQRARWCAKRFSDDRTEQEQLTLLLFEKF